MQIIKGRQVLLDNLSGKSGETIGFVPTMGALHDGHLSLVRASKTETSITIISIFVNPTQFNDPEDLRKYPRDIEGDIMLLEPLLSEHDIIFIPSVEDIYTGNEPAPPDLSNLTNVMEGYYRPGHFDGVVRVVSILFSLVDPDVAYFGLKDFQQFTIIKEMARKMRMKVKLAGCPIVREEDGLAMSSRNTRLPEDIRRASPVIYRTLRKYSVVKEGADLGEIKKLVSSEIDSLQGFSTEYFEIVDDVELIPLSTVNDLEEGKRYYGCIAVFAGDVRVIDNMEFSFPDKKG